MILIFGILVLASWSETHRQVLTGKVLLRKARLLATLKKLVFLPPRLTQPGETRDECSPGSQQHHTTHIIRIILSLYTTKSSLGPGIKTHCSEVSWFTSNDVQLKYKSSTFKSSKFNTTYNSVSNISSLLSFFAINLLYHYSTPS